MTLAGEAYSVWVLDGNGPGTPYSAHVAAWASPLLGWPAFTALIFVFLLSPDGHLPSPRWRWAAWVTVTGLCLHTLGTLTLHPGDFVVGQRSGDRSISGPLLAVGVALVAAGLVASAVSIAWRLRTAEDDLRRQLLWIASAAAFLAFGVVVILAVPMVQGKEGTWLAALPLKLAQLAVPLCVAVAVLRHRLVQIDLIVNRALVLALATGLVAVGYVVVVVVTGVAVGQGTTGFWPSLLATALVALAFQPIRRSVVRVADRLSFGAAAAPYEALADFSRRVGDSPDPSDLLPAVAEAAGQAVAAGRVVVLLHVDSGPDQRAVWASDQATDHGRPLTRGTELAVVDHGERLGSITVEMPAGRPLRVRERRLLADLADQAGLAFRSARLSAELSGQVAQLRRRTDELAASRRRLITAADAERSRLERAITREVLLHLQPLPDRLRQLSSARPGAKSPVDPVLARAAGRVAEHSAGGVARDHPRRLPRPARPLRTSHGAHVAARPDRQRPSPGRRGPRHWPALRPRSRGRGLLLRRRGGARPRRARGGRAGRSGRPAAAERERYRPRGPAGRRDAGPRRSGGWLSADH